MAPNPSTDNALECKIQKCKNVVIKKRRQLNGNALASMDSNSLQHLPKLRTLRLESNLFYRIPTNALAGLKTLEALFSGIEFIAYDCGHFITAVCCLFLVCYSNLGSNLLTIINDEDFPYMPNLVVLLLKRNQIMKITSGAFSNLTALKVFSGQLNFSVNLTCTHKIKYFSVPYFAQNQIIELDDNLINTFPEGLNKLTHLQELLDSIYRFPLTDFNEQFKKIAPSCYPYAFQHRDTTLTIILIRLSSLTV
uniref:Uncharacterized protein n=1 Tax=Glossina palpalis gambiensis TaxID=67801 RepID=A0A1B0B0R3_9MUSC